MISPEISFARASRDWRGTELPATVRQRLADSPVGASIEELLQAVCDGALLSHYQPIVVLSSGGLIGAEALARWNHPVDGLLSAGDFLPQMEKNRTLPLLAQCLLERTLQDWSRLGPSFSEFGLSINIAASQLADRQFVGRLLGMLTVSGLQPGRLTLDIGDCMTLPKGAETRRALLQLRQAGVNLALDKFGVCPDALLALRDLPFNKVKLDRAFVTGADCQREKRKILTWVARMSQDLEVEVFAEGIETDSCLDLVRSIGFQFGQGFLLGRPIPFERLRVVSPLTTKAH